MRSLFPAALAALAVVSPPISAQDVRREIGLLTCAVAESDGPAEAEPTPIGQGWNILCSFRPSRNTPEETYSGTLQSVGDQRGLARGVMMWVVKGAPGGKPPAGVLQQTYSADAGTRAAQSTTLVGDADRSIALHTLGDAQAQPASPKAGPTSLILTIDLKLKSSPA